MKRNPQSLYDQRHEIIKAYILDPEGTSLSPELQRVYERVIQAARLVDDYPNDGQIRKLLQHKYNIGESQARSDVAMAKELFKSRHTFDWDFWFAWMLKDQTELIRRCKASGDLKAWNAAKKTMFEMIGERPSETEDPRRMEKNVFYIQMNYDGRTISVPKDVIEKLSKKDLGILADSCFSPIEEAEAEDLMNS